MTIIAATPVPTKPLSLSEDLLRRLAEEHGTPLYVYDLEVVRRRVDELRGFDVIRYAQKANPNLALLRFLRTLGVEIDAVSAGELHRALAAGFGEGEIHFTADLFDRSALELVARHAVKVNVGSADMIEQLAAVRTDAEVTLRINPGFGHGHDLKVNTGGPHSKHGIWFEELPAAVERARRAGVRVTGLHVHIGSGSDFEHLSRVRHAVEDAALRIEAAGERLTMISTGGGLPIPYRPGDRPFDVAHYIDDWQRTKERLELELGRTLTLEVEPGRYLVAECGTIVAEVRATKHAGTPGSGGVDYILVDAGFNNLVRPALYGAYHHVSILGREHEETLPQVVAGPLCESADMFTQTKGGVVEPRELPRARVGDLLCVHDAGAYAASMAFTYNARPLAPEVVVEGGVARLARRRQTFEDLLALEL
ncbi:MAG TPA: diaminopimelate decarboxylase [Thermoanaerobaculia bacterium]|nr:diaminopimelate decarboxylase [Thermoanaerobaculia bacterium]